MLCGVEKCCCVVVRTVTYQQTRNYFLFSNKTLKTAINIVSLCNAVLGAKVSTDRLKLMWRFNSQ
jgi:hypothetical protein